MDEPTVEIYNQGAAAFLLMNGVRLLRVNPGEPLATYQFDNRNGAAVASLREWRRGAAQVPARDFVEAFRTIMSITKKSSGRPAPVEEVTTHGNRV